MRSKGIVFFIVWQEQGCKCRSGICQKNYNEVIKVKICVIGKISPIQGGVSKLNFWICQALAESGHEVHVVTNGAEVEPQYRTIGGKIAADLTNTPLSGLMQNLTIHYTDEKSHYSYIPFSNPFVSKLSSIAIDVIKQHGCDIIFGHYFEPYGVAAYIASKATGVPFGLQHAGSDVGRLLQSPELRSIYTEIIRDADYLFTSNSTRRRFIQEGADPEKIHALPRSSYADYLYTPDCEPLDLTAHIVNARTELKGSDYENILDQFPISNYVPSRATIGIYGKTGESKGSYDLIEALKILKNKGIDFNFFALTNSNKRSLNVFLEKVRAADLADRTVWLPFVPHWEVPKFIKLCDVVCFLERDFSIPIHQPAVAVEVMMCGTCLVVSDEVANKQRYKASLKDGENILIVSPKDINALAEKIAPVLTNKSLAQDIGAAARTTILENTASFEVINAALSTKFEEIHTAILTKKDEKHMIEFQSFLNRLYTDDIFRKLNGSDPEAAQSFFTLTVDEKTLLRQIESKVVEECCGLIMLDTSIGG
jgi:glycosyltransferase involved in cell wall biosynthesis